MWAFLVKGQDKAAICHIPEEDPNNRHTITIAIPAVKAHLAHGDSIGECGLIAECGNNIVEPEEECDDGNTVDGDGCSSLCEIEVVGEIPIQLKDGHIFIYDNEISGKHIDDVGISTYYNYVRELVISSCTFASGELITDCGRAPTNITYNESGEINPDEVVIGHYSTVITMENGNQVVEDIAIIGTPVCGDGIIIGLETCDDGNTVDGDGCSSSCKIEIGNIQEIPIQLLDGNIFIYDTGTSGSYIDDVGISTYYSKVYELVVSSCTFAPGEPITDCEPPPNPIIEIGEVVIGYYSTVITMENGNQVLEYIAIIGTSPYFFINP